MKFLRRSSRKTLDPSSLLSHTQKCVHSSLKIFYQTVFKQAACFDYKKFQPELAGAKLFASARKMPRAPFQFTQEPRPRALVNPDFNVF